MLKTGGFQWGIRPPPTGLAPQVGNNRKPVEGICTHNTHPVGVHGTKVTDGILVLFEFGSMNNVAIVNAIHSRDSDRKQFWRG